MILLFAPTMQQAEWWCRYMNDPPINPRGNDIRIFTPATGPHATRGRHLVPGKDRVVIYNEYFVYDHLGRADRDRWYELMASLKGLEYSSPGWTRSMLERVSS